MGTNFNHCPNNPADKPSRGLFGGAYTIIYACKKCDTCYCYKWEIDAQTVDQKIRKRLARFGLNNSVNRIHNLSSNSFFFLIYSSSDTKPSLEYTF